MKVTSWTVVTMLVAAFQGETVVAAVGAAGGERQSIEASDRSYELGYAPPEADDRVEFAAALEVAEEVEAIHACLLYSSNGKLITQVVASLYEGGDLPGNVLVSREATVQLQTGLSCFEVEIEPSLPVSGEIWIGLEYSIARSESIIIPLDVDGAVPYKTLIRVDDARNNWYWDEVSRGYPLGVIYRASESACIKSPGVECLRDGRFEVKVSWSDGEGLQPAGLLPFTDQSLLGYFASSENIELIVKVLDGCSINGHFWLFAGGATDREVSIELRDTVSGSTSNYTTSVGEPFVAIRDVRALAVCPPP